MNTARVIFLMIGLWPVAALADDTCQAQAAAHKLTAEQSRTYLEECKQVVIMVCEGRVVDQKIADAAKDSFIKTCIRDEMGR